MANAETTQMVTVAGRARLRVSVSGQGPTTVVLLHGWMMTSSVFDTLLPFLRLPDCRVVRVDLRGAGGSTALSSKATFALADFGDDVVGVLDALGVDRAVVVGHSMGGQLALWLAAQRPDCVSAVCAITPVPLSGAPLSSEVMALFTTVAHSAEARRTVLQQATHLLTPTTLAALGAASDDVDEACLAAALITWSSGVVVDPATITVPVLVIGSDDPFLPLAFLEKHIVDPIAGARLSHVPGAGHYPLVEAPSATADLVNAFIAGLTQLDAPV